MSEAVNGVGTTCHVAVNVYVYVNVNVAVDGRLSCPTDCSE